jgi:hypothetical protein
VIIPSHPNWNHEEYIEKFNASRVPEGFKYNSGTNSEWLSAAELRMMIKKHVDPGFEV